MATASCESVRVSLVVGVVRRNAGRAPDQVTFTCRTFDVFHKEIRVDRPVENNTSPLVLWSTRYKRITTRDAVLKSTDRVERPTKDLRCFQKDMSFLNASTSNKVCSIEITRVNTRYQLSISVKSRRILSRSVSPRTGSIMENASPIYRRKKKGERERGGFGGRGLNEKK